MLTTFTPRTTLLYVNLGSAYSGTSESQAANAMTCANLFEHLRVSVFGVVGKLVVYLKRMASFACLPMRAGTLIGTRAMPCRTRTAVQEG